MPIQYNKLNIEVYLHGSDLHLQPASPIFIHAKRQPPWKSRQGFELDERKFHKTDCVAQ